MKKLEIALQMQYENELKMLKELAFFLELEGIEYHFSTEGKVQIWAEPETEERLTFRIETYDQYQYILHTTFFDTYEAINLDKIQRVQAKTIVNNIKRIVLTLSELLEAKQQQREIWKKEREDNEQRYKEKIRQELIAEMENEKKQTKTRKKRKTTKVQETIPVPVLAESETTDFNWEAPDF